MLYASMVPCGDKSLIFEMLATSPSVWNGFAHRERAILFPGFFIFHPAAQKTGVNTLLKSLPRP